MRHNFIYLFPIGSTIQWSGETAETLVKNRRYATPADLEEVKDFITRAKPGDHMSLSTGEMIVRSRD